MKSMEQRNAYISKLNTRKSYATPLGKQRKFSNNDSTYELHLFMPSIVEKLAFMQGRGKKIKICR